MIYLRKMFPLHLNFREEKNMAKTVIKYGFGIFFHISTYELTMLANHKLVDGKCVPDVNPGTQQGVDLVFFHKELALTIPTF